MLGLIWPRWTELTITNDHGTYVKIINALTQSKIPYRDKVQYIGCGTRRNGTIGSLGEKQECAYLYQVFVKKTDVTQAKFICKQN